MYVESDQRPWLVVVVGIEGVVGVGVVVLMILVVAVGVALGLGGAVRLVVMAGVVLVKLVVVGVVGM